MKPILAILALLAAALALPQSFAGSYTTSAEGSAYKLTLKQDAGGNVTGTLHEDDAPYVLKGKVQNGIITGTCSADGETLNFKIERKDGALVMTVFEVFEGETEEYLALTFKTGGSAGASSSAKPAPSEDKPKAEVPSAGTQKLLWGSTLTPVKGWSVKYAGGEAQLVPPSKAQSEGYVLPVVAVPGGMKADNPQFSPMVKQYLAQATMGMSIVAEKPLQTKSGPGLLLAYEGADKRMHVYVTVQNGLGVGIIASGDRAQILKRANDLGQMFSSMGVGSPQQDASLTGTWRRFRSQNTGVDTRDGSSSSSRGSVVVQLNPDGRYAYEGRSRVHIQGDGISATSGSTTNAAGRWFAANGVLVLVSDEGDPEFLTYTLNAGGSLRIVDRAGGVEVYGRG